MFPAKRKWLWEIKNDGWEDLGEVEVAESGTHFAPKSLYHKYCGSTIHVGKESGELFRFCPKCLVKITIILNP